MPGVTGNRRVAIVVGGIGEDRNEISAVVQAIATTGASVAGIPSGEVAVGVFPVSGTWISQLSILEVVDHSYRTVLQIVDIVRLAERFLRKTEVQSCIGTDRSVHPRGDSHTGIWRFSVV